MQNETMELEPMTDATFTHQLRIDSIQYEPELRGIGIMSTY